MKFAETKRNYPRNFDLALIISLCFILILFRVLAFIEIEPEEAEPPAITISVEDIPQTRHGKKRTPPPKPPVVIPSDEEDIPEDETIEPIDLKYFADGSEDGGGGNANFGFGSQNVTPPRPLAWVVPEYPNADKSKGVKGKVKMSLEIDTDGTVLSVIVLENETKSAACEKAAINAAKASRFVPAKQEQKPVKFWLTHEIYFDLTTK